MTYKQVLKFFGTQVAVAAATGYTQPAVSNWKQRGSIPAEAQLRLSRASKGLLKLSRSL
jgi:hypothetical protein